MTGDVPADVFLDLRAEHAEGPIWDALSARLWWVDIIGQAVHCSDPGVGTDTAWTTPWQPGGVVLDTHGRPVVAAPGGLVDLDTDTGAMTLRTAIEGDKPENRANDVSVDSRGRCWLGTMAFDKRPGNAALYLVDSGVVTCAVDGLTISNGPALDEAGGRLYLADTALSRVDVFDLDPASGALTDRRPFVDLSAEGYWPDGMTVDAEGMLWVACGRAGAVHRYRPDGTLDGTVGVPTTNPTSVAFGGTDGADLYITTSWFDLEPPSRAAQPLAGAIFTCRPGVTGAASNRYAGDPTDPSPTEEGGPL